MINLITLICLINVCKEGDQTDLTVSFKEIF